MVVRYRNQNMEHMTETFSTTNTSKRSGGATNQNVTMDMGDPSRLIVPMTIRLERSPQQVSKARKIDWDVDVGKKENWVKRSRKMAKQGEIKITECCKTETTDLKREWRRKQSKCDHGHG